jgi:ceramide glucosyltransferase
MFVLADSDMRVGPDYLTAVVAPLEYGAGLVTCLYRGLSAGGFCSDIAALHINHGFLPQVLVAESLGLGAGCFGATMAFSRATLAATGGFEALADTLADDHELGQAVGKLGLEVVLSSYIVDDIVAEADFGALYRHELRWARTIRLVAPAGFIGSIVTFPVPLALLATLLGALPIAAPAMLLVALVCRTLTAARIDRALRLNRAPAWILPLRDMLSFGVFIASFFGRGVAWRDQYFRIGPDGQLVLDAKKS